MANAPDPAQVTPAPTNLHASTETPQNEAGGGGLPQFQFANWPGQIVWMLAIFLVLYLVLSRRFLPRLRHAIDHRGHTIAEALADAKALRDEAEAQAKTAEAGLGLARAKAQKTAAEAKARAKAEAAAREAEEETRIAGRLAEAEAGIRAARDEAMGHVHGIAADTASALVAKLTGRLPQPGEVDAALNRT